MTKLRRTLALIALAWLGNAHAGVDESMKASQAKDFPTALSEARKAADAHDPRAYFILGVIHQAGAGVPADSQAAFTWFEKAARGGVLGAYAKLATAYMRGDGAPKDTEKALAFARAAARAGDPEGHLLVSVILTANPLSQLDASGKPDSAKYQRLAARPLAERGIDSEASDALYVAAEKRLPMAMLLLATTYGGRIGDGNRKKMDELIARLPGANLPALQRFGAISKHMNTLGESYTTPQLFIDAQSSQATAALLKACDMSKPEGETRPKLVSTAIARPVSDAVYLPSKVPGYEHAYLIAGNWDEEWKYEACGKMVSLTVTFVADGMGGATFTSQLKGKDIPSLYNPKKPAAEAEAAAK